MASRRKKIIIIVVVLLIIALGIWALFYFYINRKQRSEITLYGNVDVRLVEIGFRVSGRVEQMPFEEGDFIKAGTLMATLEENPYDAQLQEALDNLESVKANFQNAEILLKRRRELIGGGGVSQEDLDNAESNYYQLKANLEEARSAVTVARDNLSYTKSYAPTDGIILTRIREPGSVVNPTDPVYTLSIISPVWIRAFVPEPELGDIYYGMPADIYTDTEGQKVYQGQIGFISPMAEFTPKTVETTQLRTDLVYRLRIYVQNPDRYLKQGMPVTVKLKLPQRDQNSMENSVVPDAQDESMDNVGLQAA